LVCGYRRGGCWLVGGWLGGWLGGGACGATAAETARWLGGGRGCGGAHSNWAFVHVSGEL